jgi:predicted HTH transcriptional regulator
VFGKPLSAVTAEDIERLRKDQVRESDIVEFKRELLASKGRHRWYEGGDEVGETARDAIANEIMAFANAHGGTLVLGIAETKDKPARADTIIPVARCADLARRLAQMLGDIIEPSFAPFPAIVPVTVDGDAGVIVFQVAGSRNAPHRHRQSRQSYVRRGEEAVPMTMREIQDLTLQVERGLALLDRQFNDSATRFETMCRPSTTMAMRATAVPLRRTIALISRRSADRNGSSRLILATYGTRRRFIAKVSSPFRRMRQ